MLNVCIKSHSFQQFINPFIFGGLQYPHCLYFLELLQNASFCNAMAHPANKVASFRNSVSFQIFIIFNFFFF
ncbi:hypothetical protein Hanom_Chr13g01220481 [Helianthus anomalus]